MTDSEWSTWTLRLLAVVCAFALAPCWLAWGLVIGPAARDLAPHWHFWAGFVAMPAVLLVLSTAHALWLTFLLFSTQPQSSGRH